MVEKKPTAENMEQQIEKAQEKVIRTKADYEHAVEALQKLLDKRDAQRKERRSLTAANLMKRFSISFPTLLLYKVHKDGSLRRKKRGSSQL